MKTLIKKLGAAIVLLLIAAPFTAAEIVERYDRDINYSRYIKYENYLDVEIWTDDNEYYEGDNIQISFQADQDCFVAVYNVDTRGHVNLIYPSHPQDEFRIDVTIPELDPQVSYRYRFKVSDAKKVFRLANRNYRLISAKKTALKLKRIQ